MRLKTTERQLGQKNEEKIRQTVANTKVPVHGNLTVDVKDDEAIINSMSF